MQRYWDFENTYSDQKNWYSIWLFNRQLVLRPYGGEFIDDVWSDNGLSARCVGFYDCIKKRVYPVCPRQFAWRKEPLNFDVV